MHTLPLNAFLIALTSDGIRLTSRDYERIALVLQTGGPWTTDRLRATLLALLARDEDQQELITRHFEDFFTLPAGATAAYEQVDLHRALADLHTLAQTPAPAAPHPPRRIPLLDRLNQREGAGRPEVRARTHPRRRFRWWVPAAALLVLGVVVAMGYLLLFAPAPVVPGEVQGVVPVPTTPVTEAPGTADGATQVPARTVPERRPWVQQRRYRDVPAVETINLIPLDLPATWQRYAAGAAGLLCLTLLYALWLWRKQKLPEDAPAGFDPAGPRYFSPGVIGGSPAAWLDAAILDHLADSMGYFSSEEGGQNLNVTGSIKATMQRGGIPTLAFHKRKQVRSLLILEDAQAEASAWNPVARELAAGIARRGVPVLYGQFQGSPEQFKAGDGPVYRLEDLEDQRQGYLLLLFTDGTSFDRPAHSSFALEALARWPLVAWMDLREPHGWDATALLPTRYGIPIYPATAAGLLLVAQCFLTEQGGARDYAGDTHSPPGRPDPGGMRLEAYVEYRLGEALLWAQECAMIQPVSPGLADALRREFHPDLHPERIERLYALPGTRRSVSVLCFSDAVLKVLRRGFLNRRTDDEQATVLRFILHAIDKVRPDAPDSLAVLAWEAFRERVRLELEPDAALKRLAALAQTPLKGSISSSLERFGFPDQAEPIPLRVKPTNPAALQRLARIAEGFPIRKLEAFPIAWGHRVALAVLAIAFIGMTAWSIWSALHVPPPEQNWQVVGLDEEETIAQLERWTEEGGSIVAMGSVDTLPSDYTLAPDQAYRLTLFGGGHHTSTTFPFRPDRWGVLVLEGQGQEVTHPCSETNPKTGLRIERCPALETAIVEAIQFPTWRKRWQQYHPDRPVPGKRLLSVGIALVGNPDGATDLVWWHQLLLQTGSVDVIYTVPVDPQDGVNRAWPQIEADLGLYLGRSQVVWWSDGGDYKTEKLEEKLTVADGVLALGTDLAPLKDLFRPGEEPVVTQEEMLQALQRKSVPTSHAPVVLFRPVTDHGVLIVSTDGISATITLTGPAGKSITGRNGDWFELPAGEWQVQAEATGYTHDEQILEVGADSTHVVILTLVDPSRLAWVPPLVEIPAGAFLMGSTNADKLARDDEKLQHEVTLETYWIGRTEVTNAQFRPFVQGNGYTNPDYWTTAGWEWREAGNITQPAYWGERDFNDDLQPVVGINWYEAVAYTRWLSVQTGQEFRLPTEAEWEKAARGTDGRIWPWGNDWVAVNCNFNSPNARTTPVGEYPAGASPYGVLDMAGNAWEWTATKAGKKYPYEVAEEWNTIYLEGDDLRMMRGVDLCNKKDPRGAASRYKTLPQSRYLSAFGLRVASDTPPPEQ